ncbi:hypothetical protein G7054_g12432 [Neopestalotiopsis clavispora]|nr:hypothetical protein G7054_g12432 [Neopestalotiopsis clavispora]
MDTQSSRGIVLVTGASGFIGTNIVAEFLKAGYHVRGTVRSESSARTAREAHPEYDARYLSFSIVPDIVKKGAFDEAVKGVDGVIHSASPFVVGDGLDNERDLLIPAIEGTKNILESVKNNAPNVKRVVITSSFASIADLSKGKWPEHTYTEADWNPETYGGAAQADVATAYCASKALAERAAWDFMEQERPNFSLTTICPPMVWGPIAHRVTSMDALPTSPKEFYQVMNGSLSEPPQTNIFPFVDVRDVALAHLRGYEVAGAAGQRFFTTGGRYSWQLICDILREKIPALRDLVPIGNPNTGLGAEVYKVNASKAERVLNMQFRDLEQVVVDAANSLIQLRDSFTKH